MWAHTCMSLVKNTKCYIHIKSKKYKMLYPQKSNKYKMLYPQKSKKYKMLYPQKK